MAFENLNPVAAIWKGHGLRYLIRPADYQEAVAPPKAEAAPIRPAREFARPVSPVAAKSQPKSPPRAAEPEWQPAPVAEWPEIWQKTLAKTKKARVAWTFKSLGEDLLAGKPGDQNSPRARRSQILRFLLGQLRHPAGSHTFWPAQMEAESDPEINLFWSGVAELGCRGVVILDPDYASQLTGAKRSAFNFGKYRGFQFWVLPAIDSLDENSGGRVIAYLRGALAYIVPQN